MSGIPRLRIRYFDVRRQDFICSQLADPPHSQRVEIVSRVCKLLQTLRQWICQASSAPQSTSLLVSTTYHKGGEKKRKSKHVSIAQDWDAKCQQSFPDLTEALTTAPVLGYADFSQPFILETDSSLDGLGAVLSQEQEGGRRVIAYASRSPRPAERRMQNYSSIKLEFLALKWAMCDKFRHYLLGAHTVVIPSAIPSVTCRRANCERLSRGGQQNSPVSNSLSSTGQPGEIRTRMHCPGFPRRSLKGRRRSGQGPSRWTAQN